MFWIIVLNNWIFFYFWMFNYNISIIILFKLWACNYVKVIILLFLRLLFQFEFYLNFSWSKIIDLALNGITPVVVVILNLVWSFDFMKYMVLWSLIKKINSKMTIFQCSENYNIVHHSSRLSTNAKLILYFLQISDSTVLT